MIEAELPDGRVLEFPDGTDPAVIQSTVKKVLGVQAQPAPPTFERVAGAVNDAVNVTGTAATKGVANLIGLPRDLRDFASTAGRSLGIGDKIREWLGKEPLPADAPMPRSYIPDPLSLLPSSRQVKDVVFKDLGVPEVNATSSAGKLYQAGVEGAATAPFSLPMALYGALSGTGSEAAGQVAQSMGASPGVETAARIGGGILAPIPAMLYQGVRRTPARIANEALEGVTPQQIQTAQALMDDATRMGTNLTAAEAIAQVTGGNKLQAVQRSVEQSTRGGPIMQEFMNRRPMGNTGAFYTAAREVGPDDLNPAYVAQHVGDAATDTIQAARRARTAASRPHYEAAAPQRVNPDDFAGLLADIDRQIPLVGAQSATGAQLTNIRQRIANAQTIGELDTLYKEIRDQIDALPMHPNAMQATQSGVVGPINDRLGDLLRVASPDLDLGRELYARNTVRVEDLRRPEVLGNLQQGVAETGSVPARLTQQINAIVNGEAVRPEMVRRIAGELRMSNPEALGNLMRIHLENTFNRATARLVGGQNQWGAAKFAKELTGNAQEAANLRAAIESLPNGRRAWTGLQRLLTVFEAQGKRLAQGSPTAENMLQQSVQSGGGAARAITRSPARLLGEWYDQFRLGRNSRQLATWLTDPRGVELLQQAAMINPASTRAEALATELIAIGRETPD